MLVITFLLAATIFALIKAISIQSQRDKLDKELKALQATFHDDLHKQLDRFRNDDLKQAKEQAMQFAQLEFEQWKADYTCTERADAVKKSRAVNRGLISEQFAPYLAGFEYNPKDAHFLGQPVDYVIFNGLDSGLLKEIVLVDVKTGQAALNARQRQVKDICARGAIRFETFRPETN